MTERERVNTMCAVKKSLDDAKHFMDRLEADCVLMAGHNKTIMELNADIVRKNKSLEAEIERLKAENKHLWSQSDKRIDEICDENERLKLKVKRLGEIADSKQRTIERLKGGNAENG